MANEAEELMAIHLRANQLAADREYRFGAHACGGIGKGLRARLVAAGLKDWRFDFALIDLKIAIEIEGGGWSGGRHTRGAGFAADLEKYDAAMRLGWTVYRCDPSMVKSGRAIQTVLKLVEMRNEQTC